MLEAFQRIRATMTHGAPHHRAAQARAVRRGRTARATRRLEGRAPHASCASTRIRATTSSSSTRSASSRSSSSSRRRSSSAAASSTPEATISWSRPCSGSQSSLVRTCTTSRRSRRTFLDNGAAIQVASDRELETVLLELLGDPVRRASLGAAARALVEANRGARGRASRSSPSCFRRTTRATSGSSGSCMNDADDAGGGRAGVLSALYAAVVRRRRELYAARPDLRRRLRNPVISVGNIAVGGRGKTPTVACLAALLLEMGERPAVLSRGYARRRAEDGVVVVRDPDGHSRGSRSIGRRAADARTAAARRVRALLERSLRGGPSRRAPSRRDRPRPRRRVPASAARSRYRPGARGR